jgi:N-acetylmuramoyl-L-alanine amidase
MKFKKLVLMGLLCCTVSVSRGILVLAAEANADTVKSESTVPENEADETGDFEEDITTNEELEEDSGEEMEAAIVAPKKESDGEEQTEDTAKLEETEEVQSVNIYALNEQDKKDLSEEMANFESLLKTSISASLTATIENEQAKLPAPSYTKDELMYLSCIIYCEAGSQSKKGKIAVANVIMNRVDSKIFDHVTTIKEAIYDCDRWGRQFSPVYVKSNGKWTTKGSNYEKVLSMYKSGKYSANWQKEQMQDCIAAAKEALTGKKVIDSAYLYFNMGVSSGKAKCQKSGKPYTIIDGHIFY